MTTEQHMLTRSTRRAVLARPLALVLAALAAAAPAGCAKDDLRVPQVLVAPYTDLRGEVLFAAAPFRNESGVSVVDPLAVTDAFLYQLEEARGVTTVPLNRTISAMRALNLRSIDTPAQAVALGRTLGADAVVVGTITAWAPYEPPKLGLSIALYGASEAFGAVGAARFVDPRALSEAGTDQRPASPDAPAPGRPASAVAVQLDGANHEVQTAVRAFAEGRHDPETALGWRRYLASMSLFTEFSSFHAAQRLLDAERLRLARRQVVEAQAP